MEELKYIIETLQPLTLGGGIALFGYFMWPVFKSLSRWIDSKTGGPGLPQLQTQVDLIESNHLHEINERLDKATNFCSGQFDRLDVRLDNISDRLIKLETNQDYVFKEVERIRTKLNGRL